MQLNFVLVSNFVLWILRFPTVIAHSGTSLTWRGFQFSKLIVIYIIIGGISLVNPCFSGAGIFPFSNSFSGYIESENYAGIGTREKPSSDDTFNLAKVEAHAKLEFTAGRDDTFLKTTLHGYAYPNIDSISDPWYECRLDATELYGSVVRSAYDLQAGLQVIKWGTADTLNPTSYFNPYDLTESLLKDDDQLFRGVPMLSGAMALGDSTLQTIIAPVHTPAELPGPGSPWELIYPPVSVNNEMTGGNDVILPVIVQPDAEELDITFKNTGIGIRFTGTHTGIDYSASFYHGPDRDIILKPEIIFNPASPDQTHIAMVPQYEIITSMGADIAFTLSDITFQTEATWTMDKPAVRLSTEPNETFSSLEKAGYLYWTAGGTWLTANDYTIIFEYLDGMYTDHEDRYLDLFFIDLFSGTIRKQFLDDALVIELKGLYNTSNKDSLVMPSVEWNFQNGLIVTVSGGIFSGKNNTLFGSYDSRDVVSFRARYYF